jgi:hypothetical protein
MLMFVENVSYDTALPDCRETVDGLNDTDIPAGRAAVSVTLPVKPVPGVRVSVVVTLTPACWVQELGELDMVKSQGM